MHHFESSLDLESPPLYIYNTDDGLATEHILSSLTYAQIRVDNVLQLRNKNNLKCQTNKRFTVSLPLVLCRRLLHPCRWRMVREPLS
jgi:hypothetical protein